jgi:hypothetical protein
MIQADPAFSPLTYANDLVTYAFQGKTVYGVVVDSLVLLVFTGAFLLLSARLERKFKK